MLSNETVRKLHEMRLGVMAEAFSAQLEDAQFLAVSFEDRFAMLVDAEWSARKSNRLTRLIRNAGYADPAACVENIEYHPERRLDREQILRLVSCAYLQEAHNVIILGATGAGKTYLACALGMAASRSFYSVRYIRLPDLLVEISVARAILSVSKQVTRIDGELVVTEPKTKNSIRRVALSQQAVDILVREHEQHPDNPILFPSPRTGGYWSPDAVSRINRKLLEMAGIEEHVRFHDLRHTFATMALSSGVDAKTLSSMLGHFSAGFTLDTYTHITNEMQRGAAEKIGGFMETATAKPEPEPEPPDPPEESRCKVIPFERVG